MLEGQTNPKPADHPPSNAPSGPRPSGNPERVRRETSRDAVKLLRDTLPIIPALQAELVRRRRPRRWLVPLALVVAIAIIASGVYLSLRVPLTSSRQLARSSQPAATVPPITTVSDPRALRVTVTEGDPVLVRPVMPGVARSKITRGQRVYGKDPVCPPGTLTPGGSRVVKAELLINEKGMVEDLRITQDDKVFVDAVAAALSHWHYRPFQIYDQVAAVRVPVTVVFAAAGATGSSK